MSCQRCNGLCVQGYLVENGTHVSVVKCVNCGNMIDLQIIINQLEQGKHEKSEKPALPSAKPGFLESFQAM